MKTNDVCKMLQELDPDNKRHVETDQGAICFADVLPGYYDGAGTYFDGPYNNGGKFVIDREHDKVRIYTMDKDEAILNDIEVKIVCKDKNCREDYEREIKESKDEYDKMKQKSLEEWTYKTLQKYKEGWVAVNFKDDRKGLKWIKGDSIENTCGGHIRALHDSGFFRHVKEDYGIKFKLDIYDIDDDDQNYEIINNYMKEEYKDGKVTNNFNG